jgi:ABC-2 type transport system ATP-binding protein
MSIELKNVTKLFGSQRAVDDISFTVSKGEILGFLGPNGAGKSTTMKMITGYHTPSFGEISVLGKKITSEDTEFKKSIGYLSESNPLYRDMYVREYLKFIANIHKTTKSKPNRIDEVIEMTGLEKEAHKIIGTLSKGYKQRVGLAQALLHDPEILILDEPTSGLDMNQLSDIRSLIKSFQSDKTIILSTHIMQEVQALCSRVIIINEGKIVADDPIDQLQNRIKGSTKLSVVLEGTVFNKKLFSTIKGISKIEEEGSRKTFYYDSSYDLKAQIFKICAANDYVILDMQTEKLDVEYVFQKLTKKENS